MPFCKGSVGELAGPSCESTRRYPERDYGVCAEHRAARVTAVSGKRGKRYLKLEAAAAA